MCSTAGRWHGCLDHCTSGPRVLAAEDREPRSARPVLPVQVCETHLDRFAQAGPDGRLFVGALGGIPRRRNFTRVWRAAINRAGIPGDLNLHLHDLRHTGSTWSAQSGATLKELMARIGHSSTRAAMIYQHGSRDPGRADRRGSKAGRSVIWHGSGTNTNARTSVRAFFLVEVMRRYSNRPDLLGPMLDVLRRIERGDQSDEPGGVASRNGGSLRPSDRLSEADVREIVERFRAGAAKHKLAAEYGISMSSVKRLLRKFKQGA